MTDSINVKMPLTNVFEPFYGCPIFLFWEQNLRGKKVIPRRAVILVPLVYHSVQKFILEFTFKKFILEFYTPLAYILYPIYSTPSLNITFRFTILILVCKVLKNLTHSGISSKLRELNLWVSHLHGSLLRPWHSFSNMFHMAMHFLKICKSIIL